MADNLLSADRLAKRFGDRELVRGVSFGIDRGDKIGLVGPNGAGKTTLLNLLTGAVTPDAGRIIRKKDVRVARLAQEPDFGAHQTVDGFLRAAFEKLEDTIARYHQAAARMSDESEALLQRIELLGGWDYQHQLDSVAQRLRLGALSQTIASLSGGQKKRLALARLLLAQPDIALLDEPTNHLDPYTVDWLEQWLVQTRAAVLLVTHDRYFLDRVVATMWALRHGELRRYRGNYTDYVAQVAVEEARREKLHHRRLRHLATELEWAKRAPMARTGKSAARLDRIERVQDEIANLTQTPSQAHLSFFDPPKLGSQILELTGVGVAYDPAAPLIRDLTLRLRRGERIGVIGPNGVGKSTLLRLICGELRPASGSIQLGKRTRVAHFDQERKLLPNGVTVRKAVVGEGDTVFFSGRSQHVATYLERFAFFSRDHERPIATLSGGERNRLALALFLLADANLLVLDEPTNDLDIETLNVLEEALVDFAGCAVVVSHDRYFLDKVATSIVAFEADAFGPGVVTQVEGNYGTYCALRLPEVRAAQAARAAPKPTQRPTRKRRVGKKGTYLSTAERQELAAMEGQIEGAEAALVELETALQDPAVWEKGPERGNALEDQRRTQQEKVDALYERWEELSAKAGEASGG